MTTEQPESISFKKFSNSVLPWIVLGGALIFYLATLNHWVTFSSLPIVAKISGFDPQKPAAAPLFYLITLPFHWLPPAWHALALNVFSAVCAALTLTLLARSVALLPQDRTKEQRAREHDEFSLLSIRWAWIPVVMAVMLCGFQLTFWENATVVSSEILDLLIFAYCIRCLLEFRLTENERWLYKMALIYGCGIANNWAMIAYFPAFLLALVWIRGLAFFNIRFIGRMIALLVPGLLLYLLLPALSVSNSEMSFWELLKINLSHQKMMTIGSPFISGLKFDFLTMALTSLVPMILVGTRWTSDYADVSPTGTILTNLMFRVLHLTLLVFCVWVFFDYKFSPRVLGHGMVPFLTLYYLSALSAGYLCGYVLLVFGRDGERAWGKSRSSMRGFNKAIAFVVAVGALTVPGWLFYRSFAVVRESNGPAIKTFAKQMARMLPKDAVVLSDDPTHLILMQSLGATEGQNDKRIYLNTRSLSSFRYQEYLANRYDKPERDIFRQVQAMGTGINPFALIGLVERLRATRPVYYLHPSFGYFFELFYPHQRGLVYELKPLPLPDLTVPKLEDRDIEENESFWKEISGNSLKSLADVADKIPDASTLCTYYSSAMNAWGVELQRNQQLKMAHDKFLIAWKYLDPNNVIAQINGRYNEKLQEGNNKPVQADEDLIKQINYLRGLLGAIGYFGPVDEPGACLILAQTFAKGGNLRQAAQQYSRIVELIPDEPEVRLKLAELNLELRRPDEALKQIHQIKEGVLDELDQLNIDARAFLLKDDFTAGENLLLQASAKHPKDDSRLRLLFQFYLAAGDLKKESQPAEFERCYKKALGILDQLIALQPDGAAYFLNKAALLKQLGKIDEAVSTLTHLIEAEPGNLSARINRAIFLLQSGHLNEAKSDYEALAKMMSADLHKVYYGLAQVAEQQKDTAGAIKNFESYLEVAPNNTAEYAQVKNRLQELRSGKKS